ncbi:MAG: hypothetical protein Q7Q73_08225 [Verrucomicrobiota bacterium JB024]|nr:hypothetical protein [Verrucomicrobiota bacterium JB024]
MNKPNRPTDAQLEQLMQALAGDEKHRRLIAWICRQNDFQRRSLIRTELDALRLKGAPAELMAFLQALEDPAVAARAVRFLDGKET